MATKRSNSPVDEDLQRLYNEVWASFTDESATTAAVSSSKSNERDLENIYSVYGADTPQNIRSSPSPGPQSAVANSTSAGSQPQQQYSSFYHAASSTSSPVAAAKPPTTGLPSSPKSPRRALPPTPGSPGSTRTTFSMPEPEPYQDPTAAARASPYNYTYDSSFSNVASCTYPQQQQYSSGSSDLLRKATATSATQAGRRLPQKPAHSDSIASPAASYYSPSVQAHTSKIDYDHPLPDPYASQLPPGASAPALPPKRYDSSPYDAYFQSTNSSTNDIVNDYGLVSSHSRQQDQSPYGQSSGRSDVADTLSRHSSVNSARIAPPVSRNQVDSFSYRDAGQMSGAVSTPDVDYASSPLGGPSETTDNNYPSRPGPSTTSSSYGQNDPYSSYAQIQQEQHQDPTSVYRRPTDALRTMAEFEANHQPEQYEFQDDVLDDDFWDEEEEDPSRFINLALLSHIAMQLRDKIPRATHVKGSIPYERAFTGKDIVSTIQSLIQRELAINHGVSTNDRRVAVQVARSLQSQLFFYEVEWGGRVLQDGVEDVFMFLDDPESGGGGGGGEELPTGVITMLSRCYSPSCGEGVSCYAYGCPRKGRFGLDPLAAVEEAEPAVAKRDSWKDSIDPSVLLNLPESEIQRQSIIHNIIVREEQYVQDLDIIEIVFIKPLRRSGSTIMPAHQVEDFIDDVFHNILDLRECNRRLLEVLYVRQREQGPVIQKVGDIFLEAATEFRLAYPAYTGHHPSAEKRLKEEVEANHAFKLFLEQCSRDCAKFRADDAPRFDLKLFLSRPSEHLQKYPGLLEAVLKETAEENSDVEYLTAAISAIKNLQTVAQLRTFQAAMGKGPAAKWEWHDMVPADLRATVSKKEAKRQSIIFELIKGEMGYVKDLESIELMYIRPLRAMNPPIINGEKDRLERFIDDVFHNYYELLEHHKRLVQAFHEIQREQHPLIRSVTAPMMDAALNFREAYMEYIPNYPIAAYRIDDEMANNPAFKDFVDQQVRHENAHRLDMKNFINRPIPRLLRYELLLKGIMDETTPPDHEDLVNIPSVIDVIKALGKESEPGVASAKQKVELWRYHANLVFSKGESVDMDLMNPDRNLIHSGKLLRQPDSGLEWNWSELFVLLFDNYLVMTKIKESKTEGGAVKYIVNRRPIPLDLLNLVNFTDPPTQRSAGLLRNLRSDKPHGEAPMSNPNISPETDSRAVYPLTLHHNGRMGGAYVLYAESSQIRSEWQQKLEHAIGLRKVVQESNKAFEVETLSSDTFLMPLYASATQGPAWEQSNTFTGKVTCSVPFTTPDGRHLVAIGCQEGVWIGYRHDPKSMRRVLQLKAVTQCAMLESFGIFLVLADKSLFAYHIEALVPSSPLGAHNNLIPQKLNGTKDVHFFSVGTLQGRTLVAYMKKKGLDSIFRVLEPVSDKINEKVKAPVGLGSRLGFRSAKSDWFRIYRDFFLPSESFDLIFLKARIAILCAKGFEIMDLNDFNSVTIPNLDDPRHAYLAKRCDSCRPMGMFRSEEDQFLLCYDEFGLHVDKHGDPIRPGVIIEWEGTAERVACHPPYVLLFDSRFIEVRYIETGRLAQIIPGNDIRCIWDGRGVSSNALTQRPPKDPREQQEAKVHAVMTNQEGMGRSKTVAQVVFELVPTVAIYAPPTNHREHRYQEIYQPPPQQQQAVPQQHYQQRAPQSQYGGGEAPPVGYGYNQGSVNGYGYQQQQQYQQQQYAPYHASSPSTSQQQYGGYAAGRPSTADSWGS